jgi:hypothetical protein
MAHGYPCATRDLGDAMPTSGRRLVRKEADRKYKRGFGVMSEYGCYDNSRGWPVAGEACAAQPTNRRARMHLAALLQRVFAVDALPPLRLNAP